MMNGSSDTGKSGESTVVIEIQESTDPTATQESTGVARVPDVVGPSRTETFKSLIDPAESRESTEVEKIQESSGMATSQNVVEPSSTELSKTSIESAESGEATGVEKIQESLRMATVQDMVVPEQDMKTTETTEDPQSGGSQMGGGSVPLNSQTGALVPVQDPSLTSPSYLLQWFLSIFYYPPQKMFWSVCSYFFGPASQTKDDETGHAGTNDDVRTNDEEFEVLEGVSASDEHVDTKGKSFTEKIEKIGEIIRSTYWNFSWHFGTHHRVGIFSRSSESEYEWLISHLRSHCPSTVRPYYISNNGRLQFMEAVSQCTFGILYHTKNRGRINIVNVTDSLYDEELKYMSERLGKENVIVVVDDLEDTSDEERTRILDTQYSIKDLAKDIILFNATEKKSCDH